MNLPEQDRLLDTLVEWYETEPVVVTQARILKAIIVLDMISQEAQELQNERDGVKRKIRRRVNLPSKC